MRNLPYSTPATKMQAKRLVAKANKLSNGRSSLLYFLLLPGFVLALSLFAGESNIPLINQLVTYTHQQVSNLTQSNVQNSQLVAKDVLVIPETKVSFINAQAQNMMEESPEDIPREYALPGYTKYDVLSDKYDRIPETFKVPPNLKKRVGFWLDIYGKYSSRFHVIHHVDYPWIVYKVIDTTEVYKSDAHKWTKYHRAQALVKKEIAKVKRDLAALSRKGKLTTEQLRYKQLLSEVPGSPKKNLRLASERVRVQLGQKDFFKKGLVSGSKYISQMEEIFAQYDLPVELTRLPLVESSFNEDAVSKVGASGIWQFMPHIGKKYLKVSETIDERNSPLKATEAAAKLLLQNLKITKNWPFAVTAYNHGPGGILRGARVAKSKDLAVIIEKYNHPAFGFASSNFYTSFLAALHAERYQEEIFGEVPKYPPHISEDIRLAKSLQAKTLASIAGITMEELTLYNPDLKSRSVRPTTWLPKGYRVFLPVGRRARLELYHAELAENSRPKNSQKTSQNSTRSQLNAQKEKGSLNR